ncbi:hypothetical protein HMPREF2651_07745 [Corynebacterium sp. HMSC063A05]|nr:hypothetical protein HMPREF2651_07745 [Corynebacterium sp. HMSC063A05]
MVRLYFVCSQLAEWETFSADLFVPRSSVLLFWLLAKKQSVKILIETVRLNSIFPILLEPVDYSTLP